LTSYLWYAGFITSDPLSEFYFVHFIHLFSRLGHTLFFYLGTICRFSWNGTTVSHWRFHGNRRINTSVDGSKFQISPFSCLNVEFYWSRVLEDVDGSLHFTVPSVNRLNQTEPVTFSILQFWTFFRDSYFLYLTSIYVWRQIFAPKYSYYVCIF
jgi:hypothetical protein